MIVNPERVSRAEFECRLWEHSRQLASAVYADRLSAIAAIMHAFDGAVRTRRRPRRHLDGGEIRNAAELHRQYAVVFHGDYPHVTSARREALSDALAGRPENHERTDDHA